MIECEGKEPHDRRRIVLTGGPGAGKTAVLERRYFCKHIDALPESARILFGGGLRRETTVLGRAASRRAIFHDSWSSLGTVREREFQRYDAVIHLRTPPRNGGYHHHNPVRTQGGSR